jgi:predicted TIM-barrel fold metal-dependent hydrolase
MTPPNKTERRAIVDTHRHLWGKKMQAKMEEQGLLDPKQGFPQTNAQDLMAYREVFDLD